MRETDPTLSSTPPKDPGLSHLQEQIKNTMIPLLIKVFQIRLDVQKAISPPSRLCNTPPKASLEELISQLSQLDKDLKLIQVWSQSCKKQVDKVLLEAQEGFSPRSTGNSFQKDPMVSPSVQKSFQGAMLSEQKNRLSSKSSFSQKAPFWKKWMKKLTSLHRSPPS